jgi:serine/threonine protein kinase
MARVWAATNTITERPVAIKIPLEWLPSDMRVLILDEARTTSAVDHPNVVRIYDAFELEDGTPIMIMELLEGETLGARLTRKGTLPLPEAARILVPVLSALRKSHALGIVHRDLKPENVFLADTGGRTTVKLLDFGIAKTSGRGQCTTAPVDDLMVGTPRYMSPEQLFGERGLDHRVDVWAVGAVLYEVLTGLWPVRGDDMGQVVERLLVETIPPIGAVGPELPSDVQSLVDGMLVRDRARRLADLREAEDVLSSHLENEPPRSAPRLVDASALSART